VIARANAAALGLAARAQFVVGDWGAPLAGSFDLIVSNPPYIARGDIDSLPPEVRHDPRLALDGGVDGLDAYRALAPDLARLLRGVAVLELGAGQAASAAAIMRAAGLDARGTQHDLAGVERCLVLGPPDKKTVGKTRGPV
jgi:release factor glutamine methyltransferase